MRARKDYIEGTKLQLDIWGDQLAHLEKKASRSIESGRERIEGKLVSVERRRRSLLQRLREAARVETDKEWKDMRAQIDSSLSDFRSLALEIHHSVRSA